VLTTDQKGAIAEAAIVAAAIRAGIGVSKPFAPERYDLIFDVRGRLLRVQCKWAAHYGEVVVIRCRSSRRVANGHFRRDYSADEIDAIAAYCLALDRCYLFEVNGPSKSSIQLRLVPSRNNQQIGVNWADDFEFDATLAALGP
jgi:PD-(D/E)XK nuclease superfamily protein